MAGVGQALRYLGIMYGYKQGVSLVAKIQSSGLLQKLTKYASIAACVVIGGFVSNLVAMNLALSYSAGETVVSLQETLDGMMPSMLPLALTLLCFWLIDKKKVNPVPLMFAVMIVGVLGSMAGILA
jgi:mannose/fructose/N-acetylgalactosamine-specific phosphotransferase system component IID